MKAEEKTGSVMKKKYWFYIDTCCEMKIAGDFLLIYNSLNGRMIEYPLSPEIRGIVRRFQWPRNMGVIALDENDLHDSAISCFVEDVRREFMGDMIDTGLSDGKPIQLVHRERILEGVEYGKNFKSFKISDEKVMEYLSRVTVVLTDRCSHDCRICRNASEQFPWCSSGSNPNRELDIDKIASLLGQLEGRSWTTVDILGGDVFNYSHFDELFSALRNISIKKNLYVHYLQAFDRLPAIADQIDDKFTWEVLIHFPAEIAKVEKVASETVAIDPQAVFHFLIESEDDFTLAEKITRSCSLRKTEYHPFFNGKNLEMFRENVYIDKNDISLAKPSRKKIFANRMVDSLHFGKLIVLPDGKVKANIHDPVLGDIGKHSLQEIVFKELTRGRSWRKTRGQVDPCKECLYVDLCPPLSNYNTVIGKNDLCHMSPDSN